MTLIRFTVDPAYSASLAHAIRLRLGLNQPVIVHDSGVVEVGYGQHARRFKLSRRARAYYRARLKGDTWTDSLVFEMSEVQG